MTTVPQSKVFPRSTDINAKDHLVIGGCDLVDLAAEFGTPLYIYDEATLRGQAQDFSTAFQSLYPKTQVIYASKAFVNKGIAQLLSGQGLGLDVVSGGELAVLRAAGVPAETVHFHGNNKSPQELARGGRLERGPWSSSTTSTSSRCSTVSRERRAGSSRCSCASRRASTRTRIAHHDGRAGQQVRLPAGDRPGRRGHPAGACGQEPGPARPALPPRLAHLRAGALRRGHRACPAVRGRDAGGRAWSCGSSAPAAASPSPTRATTTRPHRPPTRRPSSARCARAAGLSLPEPQLIIEPGRAIIGPAGVALYTVGASKDVPGVRTYVSVDGGMADNIRPAIYGSRYEALVADAATQAATETVTIAGKYCESGDVLVRDAASRRVQAGNLLALPAAGAYAPSMASNYNLNGVRPSSSSRTARPRSSAAARPTPTSWPRMFRV